MKLIVTPLLALCVLTLSSCGSLLSSMNVGTIDDDPGARTTAQIIEDDNIETKITVNIHAENEAYHNNHLVVVSFNGYILLAGQVIDAALKSGATTEARKVQGVRRIYNELEIGPPTSAMTRTNDTWITTRIKSVLLGSSDIPGTQVKVVTENGIVYLMGILNRSNAQAAATAASQVGGVQKIVKLFEYKD